MGFVSSWRRSLGDLTWAICCSDTKGCSGKPEIAWSDSNVSLGCTSPFCCSLAATKTCRPRMRESKTQARRLSAWHPRVARESWLIRPRTVLAPWRRASTSYPASAAFCACCSWPGTLSAPSLRLSDGCSSRVGALRLSSLSPAWPTLHAFQFAPAAGCLLNLSAYCSGELRILFRALVGFFLAENWLRCISNS